VTWGSRPLGTPDVVEERPTDSGQGSHGAVDGTNF